MWNLKKKKDINEPIYKTEIVTEIEKKKYGYQEGKGREATIW